MTPTEWLLSGDTGTSSKTIATVMTGSRVAGRWFDFDVPHDPDDFGRCYRLLMVFPEWRSRLPEVAQRFPAWGPMVEAWDELTSLYERLCDPAGRYTRESYEANKEAARTLYERMQKLIEKGRLADGWTKEGEGSWTRKASA